jgi:trans-aconitate methyltransferase
LIRAAVCGPAFWLAPVRNGICDKLYFALAFYVIHEVPDQDDLFRELSSMLQPNGQILVVEPRMHVSKSAFKEMVKKAFAAGFKTETGPKVIFSKTVILKNR